MGEGVGSGRSAGQVFLAQPVLAGRRGDGGDCHGTRTVLTRRPGRSGQGYVSIRCPGGWRADGHAAPRRMTQRGVFHDPAPVARGGIGSDLTPIARHADGADPAPRPLWPGVRRHPVPWGWRADGHAPPRRMTRRGVGHDPAPLCAGRGTGRGPALTARHSDNRDKALPP